MGEATAKTTAPDGESSDDAVVAVVSLYVKTKRIYARAVSGWFAGWRWALVWATQLVFYGLPWLTWNGRPAVCSAVARAARARGMTLGEPAGVKPEKPTLSPWRIRAAASAGERRA